MINVAYVNLAFANIGYTRRVASTGFIVTLGSLISLVGSGCGVEHPLPSGLATSSAAAGSSSSEEQVAFRGTLAGPACLARAVNELRLQAILLLDDPARSNCTTADPCTTASDVASFVLLANLAFAPAKLHFIFDPRLDFAEVVNPDLNNNLSANNSGGNWSAANTIAAGFPGKIVVFLRKTAFSNFAYPPDTGQRVPFDAPFPITFAGVHPNFVAHDGRQIVAQANARSFAHELGHFVGLYHPHLTWGNFYPGVAPADGCPRADGTACTPAELDQAISNLQNARGPGALDGDLLADTPEDPGPLLWRTNGLDPTQVAAVRVNGVTYAPDRQNLMSDFGGFNLTPGQIGVVQDSVCDPGRSALVSAPQARCQDVTFVADPITCSTPALTPQMIDNGSFDPNGDPITLSLDRTGPFAVGANAVRLLVSDGTFTTPCTAIVTVLDQTRPTITPPPKVTTTICSNDPVNVGVATAADTCGPPAVTGQVIVSNGVALTSPIPGVGGLAQIGPGTHVIRWVASDHTNLAITTQTVVIQAAMQATGSFLVDDRAAVRVPSGAGAGVFNAGTGPTRIGSDAHTGGVLSVGDVQVFDRAVISGGVISAGALTISPVATVTGARIAATQVSFPASPALPAFPAPVGPAIAVNAGGRRTLAAGSFSSVTVTSGGTLILGSGDFFFQNLTFNAMATIRVTPTTRVFVRSALVLQSPFLATTGAAIQPVFLGFAGTFLSLDVTFNGTLVAPNAAVSFGTSAGLTFTGAFYGRVLEVQPQSTLVCLTSAAPL